MKKQRYFTALPVNASLDDCSDSESDYTDSIPHEDHFVKHILETVAIKKLHAAQDLNQLFLIGHKQVAILAEEWTHAHDCSIMPRTHDSDALSFTAVLKKIKLILNILLEKDKISYWTQCQYDFAVRLLIAVNTKIMKLVRKLDRQSASSHNTMLALKPVVDSRMYQSESKLEESSVTRIGGSDASFSHKFPAGRSTMLKTLRKSLRNLVLCGAKTKKTMAASSRTKNDTDGSRTCDYWIQTPSSASVLTESQNSLENDIPTLSASHTSSEYVSEQVNVDAAFPSASRQMAVIQTNLFQTEAGNGEAKEVVAELNREALIDRIVSEANAEWRPDLSASDVCEVEGSTKKDNSDSEVEFEGGRDVVISSSFSFPPREELSSFPESQSETRELLLILKSRAKTLEGKVHGATQKLREIERAFYTLHANDSQFTLKSEHHEAQELVHLVDILQEVGSIFLKYPQIQAVLSSHLRFDLQTGLLELRENGNNFCAKLEELRKAVKADSSRLQQLQLMLTSYQKGALFV